MREVFCSIISAIVFRLFFVFFVFEFGVVGATLGAIAGGAIGWTNDRKLKEGIIIGTASGTILSYKIVKATSGYLQSDDADGLAFVVHLVKLIADDLVKIIRHDEHKIMRFNKVPISKLIRANLLYGA